LFAKRATILALRCESSSFIAVLIISRIKFACSHGLWAVVGRGGSGGTAGETVGGRVGAISTRTCISALSADRPFSADRSKQVRFLLIDQCTCSFCWPTTPPE
jgi:hypothetical protein